MVSWSSWASFYLGSGSSVREPAGKGNYVGIASPKTDADLEEVIVGRVNGVIEPGLDVQVQAGDTIFVPETRVSALLAVLGVVSSILNLFLRLVR